ncbi:hypothetical protein [Laceyella tengchongensis]|uniref:hypothetical protein n=1 Tax=Laceyella tengchongensis TaxID=574699 RepID=UPI0012B6DE89|nr:hypothetical protein [Laceyella tengchongensis]
MRVINILAAMFVLGCGVYLSLNHSHDLFMGVGYTSKQAWVATAMSEVMFIVGGINLAASRLRGYKPSIPAYLGFWQGLGLVGWSNIAATFEYGLAGWLLGGSIVTTVLIMESVMMAETKKKQKTEEKTEEHADRQPEPRKSARRVAYAEETVEAVTDEPALENAVASAVETVEPVAEAVTQTVEDVVTEEEAVEESVEAAVDAVTEPVTAVERTVADVEPAVDVVEPVEEAVAETIAEEEKTVATVEDAVADEEPTVAPQDPVAVAKEKALEVYRTEGKLPGRPRLMKLAGCRQNHAKRAIDELKAELGLAS